MSASGPLVRPVPGQSLDGIYMAAAAALGEDSTWGLAKRTGARWGHSPRYMSSESELAAVAEEIGIDVEALTERAYPKVRDTTRRLFLGTDVESRLIHKRTRRFAPATLARAPYHRAVWQITAFPFCDEDWCYLTDRCSACGDIQRWRSGYGVDLCDGCGRPLTGADTGRVPEADRADLRLAVGLLHHDPARRAESLAALPHAIRSGGESKAVAVLCALAGVADPGSRSRVRPQLPDPRMPPERIAAATAQGWRLMSGWPEAPLRLIDERMAVRPGREGDGNSGATMCLLRMAGRASVTPSLRGAAAELSGIIDVRQMAGIDSLEFERRTKAGTKHIVRARREGRITSFLGTNRDGAVHLLLPDDAARFARIMSENMAFESVAVRLGLPYRAVEELVASGILAAEAAPFDACKTPRMRVPLRDVDALEAAIAGHAVTADDSFTLTLRRAMAAIGGRLKPWASVMDLLREGRIRFALGAGGGTIPDRVLVERSLIPALIELPEAFAADDPRFSTLASKKDAAETLNQDNDRAGRLLACYPSAHGRTQTVPISDLLRIATGRVYLREIAVLQNTTASAIGGHLNVLQVRRDGLRGFKRERIAALGLLRPLV